MDIWIRSRDKSVLVSGITSIDVHNGNVICHTDNEEIFNLGLYAKESRAKEIITEIECKIKESYEQGATYMIYDMPKE